MEQILIQNNEKLSQSVVTFKLQQIERFKNYVNQLSVMEQEKIQNELESFKKHLVLHHSLRNITIKGHLDNIKRMLKVLENTNPEKEEVTDYVYEIKNSDKSCSHVSNNISSVEKYMDFKKKLVRYAKPKRPKQFIKETLTEGEITRIIQACKNIKEKALMIILSYSGIRVKSLCDLKLKDVDFGDNTLLIRKSKGRKQYLAHIPSESIKILLRYLEMFPKKNEDYLFTTWTRNNQYTGSDIRKMVKVISERANIEKNVSPHTFRHSLASNMLNRGANIILIKEQLGHDWIESTMVYCHSFPQRIKSEYEIYKPSYI